MPPLIIAIFLAAHGLVHASFAAPAPPATPGAPAWPFRLDRSWLLTPLGVRPPATAAIGRVLMAIVIVGFAASALAVLGVVPASWFVPVTVTASIASAAMLVLFFAPWLVLGVVIDVALLAAVLVAGWTPTVTA